MEGKFEKLKTESAPEKATGKLDRKGVEALVEKYEAYGLSADEEYFIIPDYPEKGRERHVLRFLQIPKVKKKGGREIITYTKIEDRLRELLAISLQNREYNGPDPQSLL